MSKPKFHLAPGAIILPEGVLTAEMIRNSPALQRVLTETWNAGYSVSPDGKSICCHTCGLTSHNNNDVKNRFCGNCRIFHEDSR